MRAVRNILYLGFKELHSLVRALNRNYLLRMSSTPGESENQKGLMQINSRGKK